MIHGAKHPRILLHKDLAEGGLLIFVGRPEIDLSLSLSRVAHSLSWLIPAERPLKFITDTCSPVELVASHQLLGVVNVIS